MQRRTIVKGAALGGLALIGGGGWTALAVPTSAAISVAGARATLDALAGKPLVSLEGWSPAEVFNHCAQSVEYSLHGYPLLKPAWFRSSAGALAYRVFSLRGGMRHALDEPIPGAPPLIEPADVVPALQRLQQAFADFETHAGELAPHFAYGALSHADYGTAHALHLFDHLRLIQVG